VVGGRGNEGRKVDSFFGSACLTGAARALDALSPTRHWQDRPALARAWKLATGRGGHARQRTDRNGMEQSKARIPGCGCQFRRSLPPAGVYIDFRLFAAIIASLFALTAPITRFYGSMKKQCDCPFGPAPKTQPFLLEGSDTAFSFSRLHQPRRKAVCAKFA